MVLYICVKFHENILIVFKLQYGHEYMTEITIYNVRRTQKETQS